MDILFKNITAVTMQEGQAFIENSNIGVKDGKITFASADTKADRVIDGTDKLLIPGLYNCHCHTPMTLLRGYGNDLALEKWLFDYIFPVEAKMKGINGSVRIGALLAIAEMVASGTIAYSDTYFGLPEIAQAAEESGVKANLSNMILSFDPENYDFKSDNSYKEVAEVLKSFHNAAHGRIKAEASIHCAYTSHPDAWEQVTAFAKENGLGMQVHLSETITEHNKSLEMFDLTPAAAFAKHGVFDVPTVAAHACWATEEDIEILAKYNVTVAHNPVSNLKLASGVAPILDMQKKGVNIALGTDGMASNNTHDLFEEIKISSILQKYIHEDPRAIPALESMKMATVNGAKAQGRQAESGMIAEGYDADLVMINMDNLNQIPCYDPVLNLAYSTTGKDVVMTLCQGRILYENGEFTTIDIEKVCSEAKAISKRLG